MSFKNFTERSLRYLLTYRQLQHRDSGRYSLIKNLVSLSNSLYVSANLDLSDRGATNLLNGL